MIFLIFLISGDVNDDDNLMNDMNLFSAPNNTAAAPKESVRQLHNCVDLFPFSLIFSL